MRGLFLVALSLLLSWFETDYNAPESLLQQHKFGRARAADVLAAMGIKTAEVNPKGTIDMLLNEMNAFISNK
eukprot:2324161-Amphidinium_carterae.4